MDELKEVSIIFNHVTAGVRPGKRGLVKEFCPHLALMGLDKVRQFLQQDRERKQKNYYEILSFILKHAESGLEVELTIDVNLFHKEREYRNIAIFDFFEYDVIREYLNRNKTKATLSYEYIEISEQKV